MCSVVAQKACVSHNEIVTRADHYFSSSMPHKRWRMSRKVGLSANTSQFTLEGEPFQILGGSIHYFRVPRAYWRDRLMKMKACGINTLTTYDYYTVEVSHGHFFIRWTIMWNLQACAMESAPTGEGGLQLPHTAGFRVRRIIFLFFYMEQSSSIHYLLLFVKSGYEGQLRH